MEHPTDHADDDKKPPYSLDIQIGFILRRVSQRHLSIFGARITELTPMQFAAMAKLSEVGPMSQNALGRLTAMDAATIKGVVDRLGLRDLVFTKRDTQDRRRTIVALTEKGSTLIASVIETAMEISAETMAPLRKSEKATLLKLLQKLT